MSATNTNSLPDTVKQYYDTALLKHAEPRLVHTMFADEGEIPEGNGDTIEFRIFDALPTVTDSLVEGVTPTPDELSMSKIQGTSEPLGSFVTLTDRLLYTAQDPVLNETNRLQGDQAGRSIDAKLRETINGGTAVYRPNNRLTRDAITSSDVLTFDLVDRMSVSLEDVNAMPFPEHGNRFVMLLNPKMAYDLRQSDLWKDLVKQNAIDPEGRLAGNYLGDTHNVRFFKSTATKVWTGEGSGGINVYSGLMLAKGFYGHAPLKKLEFIVTPANDPLRQRNHAGWKVDFCSLIKQDAYGIRAEVASSLG